MNPHFPANAVSITAMPQYALWWHVTERCSGRSGDLNTIRWYVLPSAEDLGVTNVEGRFYSASRSIVLAGRYANSGPLVRHEMLHALLPASGHPADYFQDRCGGVVACNEACLSDGGPLTPTDSTGPLVASADLVVTARADSTAPSLSRDSGWVALTVEVRNPRDYPVRLRLVPLTPGYFASATYGYRASYCDGGRPNEPLYLWRTDSAIVFAPGEVQRHVFDFQIWSTCMLVRPFFNDDSLPIIRLAPTA